VIRRRGIPLAAVGVALALSACAAPTIKVGGGPLASAASSAASLSPSPSPSLVTGSASAHASASASTPSEEPVTPSINVTALHPSDGLPPVIHRIETTDPVVFITIDDGYAKDPAVVALLKARGAMVTPFLAHNAITDDPQYFKTLEDATGQVPQDHSMTHPFLTRLGYDAQKEQICGAAAIYAKLYGTRPWLFRPPYGAYNNTTRRAAQACGMTTLVLWDASMPHSVIRYAAATKFHPGDILLIHWRPKLAHDLAIALDTIAADGLHVAALQDYLPKPS
jgi:peptidoglycan/xylan/chitin deacetylase (PgdA/CDA1 family)